MKKTIILAALALVAFGCGGGEAEKATAPLFEASAFDTVLNGKQVSLYTLTNDNGMAVQITNYGARLVDMWVPSKDGGQTDVILGKENIADYLSSTNEFEGPIVGRYGNRIGLGKFTLDGKEYQLTINDGENQLHGGPGGWWQVVWDAQETTDAEGNPAVKMSYVSPDGEEGYPGTVNIAVTYSLTKGNSLVISYEGTTDAPTVLNPTSHAYFNLHGTTASSTNSHQLRIYSSDFTPTDAGLIPTGEIAPVEGTPLDFRAPTAIGDRINTPDYDPLVYGGGYDHNWILDHSGESLQVGAETLTLAAEVYEESTGIAMYIYTDQPALQFYSGNFFDGTLTSKRGEMVAHRTGIALETQHYPDSPNHPDFPSTVLRPGEQYRQTTVYSFRVRKEIEM